MINDLTISQHKLYQRKISLRDSSCLVTEQKIHISRIRKSSLVTYKDILFVHGFCIHGLNQTVHHRKTFRHCHDNDRSHQHNRLCNQKDHKYRCDCFICTDNGKEHLKHTCDHSC